MFGISFFFDKAGWMVNFEIDQYTVCTYILNAHFSSNLCLQALYETSWEANLVITMCWEQARFSCWWQHLPRLVVAIKILCWLCGNHWLYINCWFRLCKNLRVGAAGPPKYSTPWLLWTPINFQINNSQKDVHRAFLSWWIYLRPTQYHQILVDLWMYFVKPSFNRFEWCVFI